MECKKRRAEGVVPSSNKKFSNGVAHGRLGQTWPTCDAVHSPHLCHTTTESCTIH